MNQNLVILKGLKSFETQEMREMGGKEAEGHLPVLLTISLSPLSRPNKRSPLISKKLVGMILLLP